MSNTPQLILVGAGGHANVIAELAITLGYKLIGFIDPNKLSFSSCVKLDELEAEEHLVKGVFYFMSIGGQSVESLKHRHKIFEKYSLMSQSPTLIHKESSISASAAIRAGSLVGVRSIIQANAVIGECSIINSGAIIEHDCEIGKGVHVAPGAIVLGGAKVGNFSMIGAGSIILPGAVLPDESFVKSLTIYSHDRK